MIAAAEVVLWGTRIGAVSYRGGDKAAAFEYTPAFARSGIQVAPLTMPLSREVYRFPNLNRQTFYGLPGLLADSLPDKFGHVLIGRWLARQGRSLRSFSPLERLCYTGTRGMGALEYRPSLGPGENTEDPIEVSRLVELAGEVLRERGALSTKLEPGKDTDALQQILQMGTSAGGARAKAVIAYNEKTGEVRSGQARAAPGFTQWILKFDGVEGNSDKELADPAGYGVVEYVYAQMAARAGIRMYPTRLLEENGRRHFLARRFDRTESGAKLHMLTLGALAHLDFNQAGAHSYEEAFGVLRALGLPHTDVEELYRRMVFNVVARNQDDHVKNIAFLMDKKGAWSLAPAYDLTYNYNPEGVWTGSHQMSLNGKRRGFKKADLISVARGAGLRDKRAGEIIAEVRQAVSQWEPLARELGVFKEWISEVARNLRLNIG